MSAEILRALHNAHGFNPTPPEADLAHLHVPFDSLTSDWHYEQALAEALSRGERVALIGPSGSGKSSVTAHVLGAGIDGLAPIRVRVGLEPPQVAKEPIEFVRQVVRATAKHLDRVDGKRSRWRKADRGDAARRSVAVKVGGGVPWLHGELAVELGGIVEQPRTSAQDLVEQAQQILDVITAAGLRPVLVLDDTDHWLVRPGLPDPAALLAGFFGPTIRTIAEDLSAAAAIVAVHSSYLATESYQAATGFLESQIVLPAIPDAESLGQVLARRAERLLQFGGPVPVDELIEPAAVDQLYATYSASITGRNLRAVLNVAQAALTNACDVGAEAIAPAHVDLAID